MLQRRVALINPQKQFKVKVGELMKPSREGSDVKRVPRPQDGVLSLTNAALCPNLTQYFKTSLAVKAQARSLQQSQSARNHTNVENISLI